MALLQALNRLRLPVLLAPMANITTPGFVAQSSNLGILGFHGCGYLSANQIGEDIEIIKEKTNKSFGVNLFVTDDSEFTRIQAEDGMRQLLPWYDRMGIPPPSVELVLEQSKNRYKDQLQTVLENDVLFLSFCFGMIDTHSLGILQQRGTIVLGTATSLDEAKALEELGVDGIIAQGFEAGGHRGSFLSTSRPAYVGTFSLIPQIVDTVSKNIPVIAAGGIGDARGIKAALTLGASAVQMGTRFITCKDSPAHDLHKQRILSACRGNETDISSVFSGRLARGLMNKFSESSHDHVSRYPLQMVLTNPLKKTSLAQGDVNIASMWCGQSSHLCTNSTLEDTIAELHDSFPGIA